MRAEADPTVLIVIKGLGLGGAERLVVEQATAADRRVRYEVAHVRSDKDHFVGRLREAGVAVQDLGSSGRPWPLALLRLLRERRPSIVHAHSPLPAAFARLAVRLGVAGVGRRMIYTEHNRWSAYRLPTRALNAVTMVLDHVGFAVSEEARGSIRPGMLRRRVETLHHGIDLEVVRDAAEAGPSEPVPTVPDGAFVLLHVANGRPEKAHEVLIEAFDRAADRNADLVLRLVGQHLDRPWIAGAIGTCRHPDRLQVLGYRNDVPALIAASDAVVLSSDHEGLPVVVMEALALGRPVIATAVGGIPEAVDDGVQGRLTPPRDPHALADAILELAEDRELSARMGEAAAERAKRFSVERVNRMIEDRYQDADAAGRRR